MYATKIPSDERSLVLRLIEGEEDAFRDLIQKEVDKMLFVSFMLPIRIV